MTTKLDLSILTKVDLLTLIEIRQNEVDKLKNNINSKTPPFIYGVINNLELEIEKIKIHL